MDQIDNWSGPIWRGRQPLQVATFQGVFTARSGAIGGPGCHRCHRRGDRTVLIFCGLNTALTTGPWRFNRCIDGGLIFQLPTGRQLAILGRKAIFITGLLMFVVGLTGDGAALTGSMLEWVHLSLNLGEPSDFATASPLRSSEVSSRQLGRTQRLIRSRQWPGRSSRRGGPTSPASAASPGGPMPGLLPS